MIIIRAATIADLLEVHKVATRSNQIKVLHPQATTTLASHLVGVVPVAMLIEEATAITMEVAITMEAAVTMEVAIIMVVAIAGETPLVAGTDPAN